MFTSGRTSHTRAKLGGRSLWPSLSEAKQGVTKSHNKIMKQLLLTCRYYQDYILGLQRSPGAWGSDTIGGEVTISTLLCNISLKSGWWNISSSWATNWVRIGSPTYCDMIQISLIVWRKKRWDIPSWPTHKGSQCHSRLEIRTGSPCWLGRSVLPSLLIPPKMCVFGLKIRFRNNS